jgi:hypothetical protein
MESAMNNAPVYFMGYHISLEQYYEFSVHLTEKIGIDNLTSMSFVGKN